MKNDKKRNNNNKLVITATSDIHADLIESLLGSYDIPIVRKYVSKAGGMAKIYMGSFTSSVDIFVEEKFFDKAKEILSYQNTDIEDDIEDDIVDQVTMTKRKKLLNIVLAIIIIVSIASAVLIFYVNYLQSAI